MNRNDITPNRVWACMVLMIVAVFSATAQGQVDLEPTRRERVAEVMPSINIVDISTSKKSLALSGIANIVRENALGVQIGGLYNHVGGMGCGAAIAGLGNTIMGSYYGMQIGGLSNYNADDSKGVMIGGLGNVAGGGADGLQLAGLLNIAEKARGMQLAGLTNIAEDVCGMQIGGLSNYNADDSKGVMIGGLGNVAGGGADGLQLAGLLNIAKKSRGMQLAGLTNIAEDVYGLQFAGVVNVAKRVRGVQFASILNVAEESDFPIGLINVVKNGSMGVALTYDMMGNALVSFRSGGRYSYGIVGVGCNQQAADKVVAEAGYGIHIPLCKWLQVNNEVKATAPVNTSSVNCGYLIAPSITLWNHCNLFGGASVNYLMSSDTNLGFVPKRELWQKQSTDGVQRLYIGYQVGVQYVF